jgi:hypothetical protein
MNSETSTLGRSRPNLDPEAATHHVDEAVARLGVKDRAKKS